MSLVGRAWLRVAVRDVWVALVCAGILTACAGSRRLTSGVDDYSQFRKVRLATGVEQRLKAGWHYLKTQPHGAYRQEIEPWYRQLEAAYVTNAWDYPERLRLYLDALPDAPRAPQVRARLRQLESLGAERVAEEQRFLQEQQQREARLAAAKVARGEFIRSLTGWLRTLARLDAYDKSIAEWDAEFKQHFFDQDPKGICEGDRCYKTELFQFDVPEGRGLQTRSAGFTVVLHLSAQRLVSAEVEASMLFSRLGEAAAVDGVQDDDFQGRAEAIGTSTQIIGLALENRFPRAECEQPAVSPTIVLRRCRGKQSEARIGVDADQTDRVLFLPAAASDAPVH